MPRCRTRTGYIENCSRVARRRSHRSRCRACANSAARKTRTHPGCASARCRRHSRSARRDRSRPSSPARRPAAGFADRGCRRRRRDRLPQRSRNTRGRAFDRHGTAYASPPRRPDWRCPAVCPQHWRKRGFRAFPSRQVMNLCAGPLAKVMEH